MKIISSKNKLIKIIQKDKNLGFVPTMGSIHLGHISLIKMSIKQCDKTIVSIFVNKPQFNRKSDFKKYPRVLKKDIYKLKKLKVDLLYLPTTKQIYPKGRNKNIKINSFGKKLCGKYRPGHFEAIADVIDRFIKIIKPKRIYLGEKDMQQLKIIDDFVKKNHSETKVIPCKTIREKSGVAFSSRNYLLSEEEKMIASKIFKLLINKKQNLIKNKISLKILKRMVYNFGASKIDYIEVLDVNKLIKPFKKKRKYKIFVAYYLGSTRLIDNI
jgi:pantoate--beta-alanine ligase